MSDAVDLDLSGPDWFCQQFDLPSRQLLFRPMSAESYQRSLFLDERLTARSDAQQIVAMADCHGPLGQLAVQPACFVFHVGHCGSTYLSRMLEQLGPLLALREPPVLRALAAFGRDLNHPLSLMNPTDFPGLLTDQLKLLTRRYHAEWPTLVKATSDCGPLGSAIMASHPQHRALWVTLSLQQYLTVMLRSELRRQELYHFAQSRLADLHHLGLAQHVRIFELSPGQLAAMCWLAVQRTLEQLPPDRVMTVDFDHYLAKPQHWLQEICGFLGYPADPPAVESLVASDLTRGYSKDPGLRYDRHIRDQELAESARLNGAEIDAGLRWFDAEG